MANYIINNGELVNVDELHHHGVKGMRWGVRKKQSISPELSRKRNAYNEAKSNMYTARADKQVKQSAYSRAFKEGSNLRNQFGAKGKAYTKVISETANASNKADKAYKQSKKAYKEAKRDYKEQKTVDRFKKHGLDYNLDTAVNVHNYGFRAAKRIEDRIANKGMSRFKSEMIESGRLAATTSLMAIGTLATIGLVATAGKNISF